MELSYRLLNFSWFFPIKDLFVKNFKLDKNEGTEADTGTD